MTKSIFTLLAFIAISITGFSQDVITQKSGEDIQGKILEVNQTEIKYKKFDNQNGPTFTLLKSDVLMIRYENGTKDIFTQTEEVKTNVKTSNEDMRMKGERDSNFGLKGGLNLSNMLIKDDDETYSDDFKMKPGFHVGAMAEFPLSEIFSFETGLFLSTKGYKISEEETLMGETLKMETKANLLYLDIPLTAKATFDLGGAKIYGVFGPYVGMGLSGKGKEEVTYDGETETEEEDVEWGSDKEKDDLKRLDFGLTMGGGVEINSIQIGLTYALGLANISSYTDYGTKINNRVLGLSVGYKFGGK